MPQIILHPDFYKQIDDRADNLAGLTARIEEVFDSRSDVELLRALLLRAIVFIPCYPPEQVAAAAPEEVWLLAEAFISDAHTVLREVDHPAAKQPEFGSGHYPTGWEIAHSVPVRTLDQIARDGGAEPAEDEETPLPEPDPELADQMRDALRAGDQAAIDQLAYALAASRKPAPRPVVVRPRPVVVHLPYRDPITRRLIARQGRAQASRAPPSGNGDSTSDDPDPTSDDAGANSRAFFMPPGGRR